jgi:hypothetical protein
MASPAIFNGQFTKLLTSRGVLQSNGALLENDGAKNYIKFGNFESGLTTGWGLGIMPALTNGLPTTGAPTLSGAAGTLSLATITGGSQLSGTYSLSIVSSAATTLGNCVFSNAYTIDNSDQAKVLSYKFNYSTSSGAANGNYSGTSSNSFAVAAYDTTNLVWLPVVGAFNIVQGSGIGIASGTFQTGSGTGGVRLFIYFPNASAGAITFNIDDVFVGPQTTSYGPAMTDWVSYTPNITGFGTPTGVSFKSRRVGDSLQVAGIFTSGTNTAVQAQIGLGYAGAANNVTYDSTKAPSGGLVGAAAQNIANATYFTAGVIAPASNQTYVIIAPQNSSTSSAISASTTATSFSNATAIAVEFTVPIVGWSSNTVQSSDTDTRVVSFSAISATPTGSTTTPWVFGTVQKDSNGSYNSTTGRYTIGVSGDYNLTTAGSISSGAAQVLVYKNASLLVTLSNFNASTTTSASTLLTGLLANDIIDIRPGISATLNANAIFTMSKLSGPAVVQASESVSSTGYNTSGQSLTNNTIVALTGWTKQKDTHNFFNAATGVATIPSSGTYQVILQVSVAGGVYTASTGQLSAQILQSGSVGYTAASTTAFGATTGIEVMAIASKDFVCLAGDSITLQAYNSNGAARALNSTDTARVHYSIKRIGN